MSHVWLLYIFRSPDQSRTRIEELSLDSSSLLGVLAQLAEGSIDDSSNAPQDAIQNSSMVSTSPKPGPSRSRKRQKLSDRVRTPDSASQQKALRLRSNAERNIPGESMYWYSCKLLSLLSFCCIVFKIYI